MKKQKKEIDLNDWVNNFFQSLQQSEVIKEREKQIRKKYKKKTR